MTNEEKKSKEITFSYMEKKPNTVSRAGSSYIVVLPEVVSRKTKKTKLVWWERRVEDSEEVCILHFEWNRMLAYAKEILDKPIYPKKERKLEVKAKDES